MDRNRRNKRGPMTLCRDFCRRRTETFGFLLIPALTAHLFAKNMRQFAMRAPLIGGAAAFTGFWIAYQWDCPIGPVDVVLLGIIYALGFAMKKLAFVFQLKSKR